MSYGLNELGRGKIIVQEQISKFLKESLKGVSTMKGSMKKLAVFVIVAAIAMFMAVGTASAVFHHSIQGDYAVTGTGTCLIAPFGFNPDFTPVNGAGIVSITGARQGIFTFKKDGTGSVTGDTSNINLSYVGPNGPVPPSTSTSSFSYDLTYTVTGDGIVTITQVPGTYFVTFTSGPNNGLIYQTEGVSFKGTITTDNKIITLITEVSDLITVIGPNFPPNIPNQSCSGVQILTKEP